MDTNTTKTEIGHRVDELRQSRGLTVKRLAADAQIPLTTLQRRLAGDGHLTVPELNRLSTALEVPVASWFEVAA